jgi:hypothetical protein
LSVAAAPAARLPAEWSSAFGRRIADWTLGLAVFLGAFVINEPAPYELFLLPAVVVWAAFGLKLNRHILPLIALLALYVAGGCLALTQVSDISGNALYVAVTAFLALSSIFFAAVIAEAPERRFALIKRAYIASALVVSLTAILAYFHLIPGSDLFLLYGRAKGAFQDPNVFAPFLVLPIVLLYRDILTSRLRASVWKGAALLILLFAIFLAFSRAAWGMAVLAVLLVTVMSAISEPKGPARLRIAFHFGAGIFLVATMIAIALSLPEVAGLFAERGTTLIESYDAGQFGRFGRHVAGFYLVQEHPLGLGPFVFAKLLGGDEHNMWLKGFTTYGWLGGFAYIALAVWTLVAATPLLFKPRPWQPIVQCLYAVFVGHLLIHNVIDNDHWRHLFLIYGMLWGAIAAEKLTARRRRRAAAGRPAAARVTDDSIVPIPRWTPVPGHSP